MRSTPIPVTRTLGQEQEGLVRAQLERTNQRPISGSRDQPIRGQELNNEDRLEMCLSASIISSDLSEY